VKLTQEQLGRLTRLMMLTSSDIDGEALAALRMAQKVLADAKLNWAEVLAGLAGPVIPPAWTIKPAQWQWAKDAAPPNGDAAADMQAAREAAAKRAATAHAERQEAEARDRWEHAPEVVHMIATLAGADLPKPIREFVDSLRSQFVMAQRLTPKQFEALRRVYKRNKHA
jgi:hypothetical protein